MADARGGAEQVALLANWAINWSCTGRTTKSFKWLQSELDHARRSAQPALTVLRADLVLANASQSCRSIKRAILYGCLKEDSPTTATSAGASIKWGVY